MEQYRKSSNRRRRYQKKASEERLHVLLFYVLPFIVFNSILFFCVTTKPSLQVEVADTNDYLSSKVTVQVTSFFPSGDPVVTVDGEALELTKDKNKTWSATVYKNGSIEATVKNINGMSSTVFEQINILDDNPPAVGNASVVDGVLTFTVTDSQSGVNFDSIYALNASNERVEPISVDRNTNTLSYQMPSGTLHVYAQDKAGNEAQSTLTAHKEGAVETSDETSEEAADAAAEPEVVAE